jgi:hypothetical protein
MIELRICTDCPIHHYENCDTCFGFGVYSDIAGDVVTASEAIDDNLKGEVKKCPRCGSDEKGMI